MSLEELRELAASAGATVTVASVPPSLDGATDRGPVHECRPGRYLLTLPSVGRFLVEDGANIIVDVAAGATLDDVACFMRGPVLDACRLQRGQFSLQGSAVSIGGRGVVLVGGPASGKSTLAAALARRDHPVVADASIPLVMGDVVHGECTTSSLALWPDVAELLGLDRSTSTPVRPGSAKRRFAFTPDTGSPALGAVIVLERHVDHGAVTMERQTGFDAVTPLASHTALRPLLVPYGLGAPHHGTMAQLARQVPVWRLRMDRHRTELETSAGMVEDAASVWVAP